MSFNEDELIKIKNAISGWFKKSAREAVTNSLLEMKQNIDCAKKLNETERKETFIKLMNQATAARQNALKTGANSYGNKKWAAAAACESWIQELIVGSPESIARVEALIDELSSN